MKTKTTKKKSITAKKMCSKVIQREGVKADGTLKKGYKYAKGGRVVKAKAPAKKTTTKRGLGKVYSGGSTRVCRRTNSDGSTTTYNSFGGSRPCPYGGNEANTVEMDNRNAVLRGPAKKKVSAKKKTVTRKEGVKADGTLKKGYKYVKGGRVVKAAAKKK